MNNSKREGTDQELRRKFDQAVCLWREGHKPASLAVLKALVTRHPDSAAARGYLGGRYLELGRHGEAAEHLNATVRLSPRSEAASLGLFHSLMGLGRTDDAFDEMRRFLGLRDSTEYRRLIRDLNRDDISRDGCGSAPVARLAREPRPTRRLTSAATTPSQCA